MVLGADGVEHDCLVPKGKSSCQVVTKYLNYSDNLVGYMFDKEVVTISNLKFTEGTRPKRLAAAIDGVGAGEGPAPVVEMAVRK